MKRLLGPIFLVYLSLHFVRAADIHAVLAEKRTPEHDSTSSLIRFSCTHDICDCNTCQMRKWDLDTIDVASGDSSEIELVKLENRLDVRQDRAESLVALLLDTSREMFTQMMNWAFEGCSREDIVLVFCDAAVFNGLPLTTQFHPDNLSRLIQWLRSVEMSESDIVRLLYKQWLLGDGETIRCLITLFPPAEAASILRREFRLDNISHVIAKYMPRIVQRRHKMTFALGGHSRKVQKEKATESSTRKNAELTSKPIVKAEQSMKEVDRLPANDTQELPNDRLLQQLCLSPDLYPHSRSYLDW